MTPEEKLRRNIIFGTIGYGAALVLGTAAGVRRAKAHDWYDRDCCSGFDCRPVSGVDTDGKPWSEIRQVEGGYEWTSSQSGKVHFFASDSPKVRPSRDGNYHACELPASQIAMCLYVPTFF
jgi:hypothetical protein